MKTVFPDFNNSILNVSSTLMNYLGKENGSTKIKMLEEMLAKNNKNVALIIIDGLGQRVLETHLSKNSFLRKHTVQTITSVFPSTTTNATTTLITATPPAAHGWFGWAMDFKEISKTVVLFKNCDYYTGDPLAEDDFTRKRLPFKHFFSHPRDEVDVCMFMPSSINMKNEGEECHYFSDLNDLINKLNWICKEEGTKFLYGYYSELDSVMHEFGADSRSTKEVLEQLDAQLKKLASNNPDSLFVITADHGHIDIKGFVDIYKDEEVMQLLDANLSLEPRAAAFRVKSGMKEKFKQAFSKYSADFNLIETSDLIEKGIFGKFDNSAHKEFLGDFIAVGTETNKMMVFADDKRYYKSKSPYKGHHTGLTEAEMVVPLIIV